MKITTTSHRDCGPSYEWNAELGMCSLPVVTIEAPEYDGTGSTPAPEPAPEPAPMPLPMPQRAGFGQLLAQYSGLLMISALLGTTAYWYLNDEGPFANE